MKLSLTRLLLIACALFTFSGSAFANFILTININLVNNTNAEICLDTVTTTSVLVDWTALPRTVPVGTTVLTGQRTYALTPAQAQQVEQGFDQAGIDSQSDCQAEGEGCSSIIAAFDFLAAAITDLSRWDYVKYRLPYPHEGNTCTVIIDPDNASVTPYLSDPGDTLTGCDISNVNFSLDPNAITATVNFTMTLTANNSSTDYCVF